MNILTSPRMQLQPLAAGDEDFYVRLYTDARTLERVGPPQTQEQARAGFRKSLERDPGRWPLWVMRRREDLAPIGVIGLAIEGGAGEIGAVCPPEHQNQGLAREGAVAVIEHGFEALGLARVTSRHVADHPLVEAVMRGLGFEPAEGGTASNPRCWELSRAQWERRRSDKPGSLG